MMVGRIGGGQGFWASQGNTYALGYPTPQSARIAVRKMTNEQYGKLPRRKGRVRWNIEGRAR